MGRNIGGRLKTNMGGRVKKLRSKKNFYETIDIVSYALKVSVNGVTCVCSPFQVQNIHLKFKAGLTDNIHMTCPPKHV